VPLLTDAPELLSPLPDTQGLPLDSGLGDAEYLCLMRRTGLADGEAGTPVSAFNSSI
jgi:hypothetical protein